MAAEMQSFLCKFMQLTTSGFDANLAVKSNHGQVFVSLEVGLGSFHPFIPPQQSESSRARRRRRNLRNTMETRINTTNDEDTARVTAELPNGDAVDTLSAVSSCAEAAPDLQKMIDVKFDAASLPTTSETSFITYDEPPNLPASVGNLSSCDEPASSSEFSDTDLACTPSLDPRQSESRSLSTPNQADDWSQKLYTELDAIFRVREDRFNNRMEDRIKSISENYYSKIKAKLEQPSNVSHDEQE